MQKELEHKVNGHIACPALEPALSLILRRIRLRAKRRVVWLRMLWQEEGVSGGQLAVTHAEIDTHLDYRDSPMAEFNWYAVADEIQPLNQELTEVEEQLLKEHTSRYVQLQRTFHLKKADVDLFQLCLAIRLDPSLARVYAYLHDHAGRGFATEELAVRLFGYGHNILWKSDSPLHRWGLVYEKEGTSGEPSMLKCDPFIVQWLLGHQGLDNSLAAIASFHDPQPCLPRWPTQKLTEWFRKINSADPKKTRFCLNGPPGSGRRTLAANIAKELGSGLLVLDADQTQEWRPVFIKAQRQAFLEDCALAWTGEQAHQELWTSSIPWYPLQFVISDPGQHPRSVQGIIESSFDMPELKCSEQEKLIKTYVPISETWEPQALDKLISQHRINIGAIRSLADRQVATLQETAAIIRTPDRNRLGKQAQLFDCPFDWDDLIVPNFLQETLEDLVSEARERKLFWEQEKVRHLFPQGRGLVALFTGPPGTGKTMAAQVIAANLGLDLFRIDLSTVVSKYVGETSQNLERILSRAQYMDIVLLFDEADALFGKRTEVRDAHDRFANTDTNYLLQAIENYQGIALLSSNKKENIDKAFIRRLRYVLNFPKPDANTRERIWTGIVGKLVSSGLKEKLEPDLRTLAHLIDLTGSQIKFSILSALFSARRDGQPLSLHHLLRGINRELQKEGRGLGKRQRKKLMQHATT